MNKKIQPNHKFKIVAVSGYFNPIHIGHILYFYEAKKLGDILVVIVNNDKQLKKKGRPIFMSEMEGLDIVRNIKPVDEVILSIDKNGSISRTLAKIKPYIFAKGGDRTIKNIPRSEINVCKKYHIKIIDGVGGEKIQSSSLILKSIYYEYKKIQNREPEGSGV